MKKSFKKFFYEVFTMTCSGMVIGFGMAIGFYVTIYILIR